MTYYIVDDEYFKNNGISNTLSLLKFNTPIKKKRMESLLADRSIGWNQGICKA